MENSSLNHTENHKTEEKETKRTPIKQRKKENEVLRFIREHIRYFAAGALVVVLILVLAMCAKPKGSDSDVVVNANATESTQATEEAYQVDANENINALITQYYTAYAAGDVTTLSSIATPISANEQSYIGLFSQYVDEYQNIKCYTKTGLDANSYLVSVSMEIKFTGVDTTAPGLDFFYVRTNDKGQVYIDNIYSSFNLNYQENPLDDTIRQLITDYEAGEDVIALQANVQTRYEEAVAKDADLKNMIETTITNAINEWKTAQDQQAQQKAQEAANQVAAEDQQQQDQQAADQQQQQDQQQAQTPTETEQKAWVYATETMNIRQEPNEQSAVLASALQGSELRQLAVTSDGWSKVKTGDIVGYVKTEYVTTQHP